MILLLIQLIYRGRSFNATWHVRWKDVEKKFSNQWNSLHFFSLRLIKWLTCNCVAQYNFALFALQTKNKDYEKALRKKMYPYPPLKSWLFSIHILIRDNLYRGSKPFFREPELGAGEKRDQLPNPALGDKTSFKYLKYINSMRNGTLFYKKKSSYFSRNFKSNSTQRFYPYLWLYKKK